MQSNNRTRLILTTALLLAPSFMFASATDSPNNIGGYNVLLMSMVGFMLLLLFVIGMLANTLRQVSAVLGEKIRKERKKSANTPKTTILLFVLLMSAIHAFGAEKAVEEAVVAPVSNFISGVPKTDFYALITMIGFEFIIIFALTIYIRILLKVMKQNPETAIAAEKIAKKSWFWDKLNAAATIEQEKDILLDHDYDGIQELDNSLPPWWKYGFYLTIIVSFIYIYRFHVSHDGQSQQEEYATEMQKGEDDKAAYLAKSANNVDENTVTMLSDAAEIGAGKELFSKNCVACHLPDGGGSVGPNLTDEYWLHGGSIKNVFKSIKYGWQDKGMKSWKDDFSPKQIQQLASFVKSLKGTKPATPKAPQGELYIESGAAPAAGAKDSTGKTTDSVKSVK